MEPRFHGHFFRLLIDLLFQSSGALFFETVERKIYLWKPSRRSAVTESSRWAARLLHMPIQPLSGFVPVLNCSYLWNFVEQLAPFLWKIRQILLLESAFHEQGWTIFKDSRVFFGYTDKSAELCVEIWRLRFKNVLQVSVVSLKNFCDICRVKRCGRLTLHIVKVFFASPLLKMWKFS